MYTEVRELVNFICRYVFGRIPRRPTGIFGADLGNYFVSQFASSWDIYNPKHGESERMVIINGVKTTAMCFETSARESGLDVNEIFGLFPAKLNFFANPGEVYVMHDNNCISIPIWKGDVNADENYQPMPEHIICAAASRADFASNLGAAGQTVYPGLKALPTNDHAVAELINGIYIPMALEKSDDELNVNLHHLREMYPYRFVFKPTSSQTFTGQEFSQTRFGSSKARPDLQTIMHIKQMSQMATASSSSSSPSHEHFFY